jgi:meiotic recombination protein REC8, fungi type
MHMKQLILNRLASTLGPKSTFKKLPKRDIMGADISQLCGLIIDPEEPLALRLLSNLMVGIVRYASSFQRKLMNPAYTDEQGV